MNRFSHRTRGGRLTARAVRHFFSPLVWIAAVCLAGIRPALASPPPADFYAGINTLRVDRCKTPAGAGAALSVSPELEAAAARLAAGQPLSEAAASIRSQFINLSYLNASGPLVYVLDGLATRYCHRLADTAYTHMGAVLSNDRWWLVLGAGRLAGRPVTAEVNTRTTAIAQRMLERVNAARGEPRQCGDKSFGTAPPLTWNDRLAQAALVHAVDMTRRRFFAHVSPEGGTPADRALQAGYRYRTVGENIATIPDGDVDRAVDGWLKSPGHCANIMKRDYAEIGAAVSQASGSSQGMWVQVFGTMR